MYVACVVSSCIYVRTWSSFVFAINRRAVKTYRTVGVYLHSLPGNECQPSGSVLLSTTHWIGGWVGPRAVLDALEKENSFFLGSSSISSVI